MSNKQSELGFCTATPGAFAELEKRNTDPLWLFARHANNDWGDLGDEDKTANDWSIDNGARILSAYVLDGTKFY